MDRGRGADSLRSPMKHWALSRRSINDDWQWGGAEMCLHAAPGPPAVQGRAGLPCAVVLFPWTRKPLLSSVPYVSALLCNLTLSSSPSTLKRSFVPLRRPFLCLRFHRVQASLGTRTSADTRALFFNYTTTLTILTETKTRDAREIDQHLYNILQRPSISSRYIRLKYQHS